MRNSKKFYSIPQEHWFRIHFVRPRFKSNIENVLLYMAKECCQIPALPCGEYNQRYLNAIRLFPGNVDMTEKTLQNWRTEIPALFGFYIEDKQNNQTRTSQLAHFLNDHQDLIQFFRFFLYTFQFPGGHLKAKDVLSLIKAGVRFKPAHTIINVLREGNVLLQGKKEMSISAEEATYCIFNDLRVLRGEISAKQIAKTILSNRNRKLKYYNPADSNIFSSKGVARTKGDVTRYAGDILDYMQLANLLNERYGYYSLKENQQPSIALFAAASPFFEGYQQFYALDEPNLTEIAKQEPEWFAYINDSLDASVFQTDLGSVINTETELEVIVDERIAHLLDNNDKTKKDIGNLGEMLICAHEKMRLKLNGYKDFVRLVQIVDSPSYHPGFDIDSYEADGTEEHRYIEVKTTISRKPITMYGFHMSPNEWRVAGTIKEHYYVYRLMINDQHKTLIILPNPVHLYKTDQIDAFPVNGMDISFAQDCFPPTELLTWKK